MAPDVVFPHLGIEIDNLSRVAFSVFGFEIAWYGVMVFSALAAAMVYVWFEARRLGHKYDTYLDFMVYALPACLIGTRLYYVAFSWGYFRHNPLDIVLGFRSGLAIYGAVLTAIAMAVWYTRKHKLDFWQFADMAAPPLILGQAIGRWGNFFNMEAFGGYTDTLLAMRLLADRVAHVPAALADTIFTVNGAAYIQVHPTFLYESLWCLAVFGVMMMYKRRKKTAGALFPVYLTGYGTGRFFIEGLRTDQLYIWGTHLAASQVLSAVLVIAGILLMIYLRGRTKGGAQHGREENDHAGTDDSTA